MTGTPLVVEEGSTQLDSSLPCMPVTCTAASIECTVRTRLRPSVPIMQHQTKPLCALIEAGGHSVQSAAKQASGGSIEGRAAARHMPALARSGTRSEVKRHKTHPPTPTTLYQPTDPSLASIRRDMALRAAKGELGLGSGRDLLMDAGGSKGGDSRGARR